MSRAVDAVEKVDGRRTDTRQRIHAAALEVFSEVGYERGSLQQIADRLGVTRPALYYHYRSKEEILAAIHAELADSVDAILDWARAQPVGRATRRETVRRLHDLMRGPWGSFSRFAQASEAAMRDLSAAEQYAQQTAAIAAALAPTDDPTGRLRGRLALDALFLASTNPAALGGTSDERHRAALAIALTLVR